MNHTPHFKYRKTVYACYLGFIAQATSGKCAKNSFSLLTNGISCGIIQKL